MNDYAEPKQQTEPDVSNRSSSEIRHAARTLGGLPRDLVHGRRKKRRKWTGFIANRHRTWRGAKVVMPDNVIASVERVQAGIALVRTGDTGDNIKDLEYVPAAFLRPWRRPEAILLGRLKRGVRERPSLAKAQSSRRNALFPARAGSRQRGRPRKVVDTSQSVAL